MNRQLQLFPEEEFVQVEPLYNELYSDWKPKNADTVRCEATIAYNETDSRNRYCYMMNCIIISMSGCKVRVSPTLEWCEACSRNGVLYNTTDAWLVDTHFIVPIGN